MPAAAAISREATSSSQLSSTSVVNQRAVEQRRIRVAYLWSLLRSTVTDTVNATLENDAKERRVAHGVHHLREIVLRNKVHQAFADKVSGCYYTVDDAAVRLFGVDGRKLDVLMPQEKINRLCLAFKLHLFVGWIYKEQKLCMFSSDFELLSSCIAPGRLYNVAYNEARNEIVACGTGFLQTYMFRFGNRHLVAKSIRIDSEVIAGWNVSLIAIENTMSQLQRCFVANENVVAVFNLNSAEHIVTKKDLHVRDITAIMFFNPLKLLLTASMDGCIKVWNEDWFLHFVFVGHTGGVTCLSAYPSGPLVVSGGLDRTIRVWSLEVLDEIDRQTVKEPVLGMNTVIGNKQFCSFGENDLHIWIIQDIQSLHSFVGCPVVKIKCTDHPNFPTRAMCICKDSSIRIVAPHSGAILTTLLLDPRTEKAVDAAYAIADETLFVALEGGDVLKCKTDSNPARVVARWTCSNPKLACNYLMVYEYVVSSQKGISWKSIARAFNTGHLEHATVDDSRAEAAVEDASEGDGGGGDAEDGESAAAAAVAAAANQAQRKADRTLLLGGRKDGYVCVVNWDTGATDFDIEAHGVKGVLSMIANSADDQVVSAGRDDVIKVWRLFPYAKESLAPLMSFFCAQTPLHMSVLRGKLGVAFDEHSTATYSIVVYSLTNKERKDHSPEDDHTDSVTALACCHRMKLFASSSLDGTIKIWSDTNKLVRHVKLNATPVSLAFYDDRGSLLVGIGKNLYKIDSQQYLPRAFLYKQVTMTFPAIADEVPRPYDDNLLAALSPDDLKRLKKAKAAYKYQHYEDELNEEEMIAVTKEKEDLQDKYELLIRREEEIIKLRNGEIKPKARRSGSDSTKQSAFLRYLAIFYDRPVVKIYGEDRFPEDTLQRKLNPPKAIGDIHSKQLDEEVAGFFPKKTACQTLTLTELLEQSGYNVVEDKPLLSSVDATTKRGHAIYPYGYLPNSVLLRLLFKAEQLEEKQAEAWQPPSLADQHLLDLELARKKAKSSADERLLERENTDELSRVFTWSDDEPEPVEASSATAAGTAAGGEQGSPSKQKAKRPRGRVSFMQEDGPDGKALATTSASGASAEAAGAASVEPQQSFAERMKNLIAKPRTPPPPKTPEHEEVKVTIKVPDKPGRPVQKLVARPPPPKIKPKTPPPARLLTPSPPPQPPPPASPLPPFVTRFFGEAWFEKLFPNVTPKTFPKPWTIEAFIVALAKALVTASYAQKPDVVKAIDNLYESEDFKNKEVVVKACFDVLNPSQDPPTCLDVNQKSTIKAIISLIGRFQLLSLEYYSELMCQFIDGDREMRSLIMDMFLVAGLVDPNHYFPNELDSLDTWSVEANNRKKAVKNICSGWLEGWMTRFKNHVKQTIDLLQTGKNVQSKLGNQKPPRDTSEPKPRALTVTIKEPPSLSVLEHAMYIEAINYFCEMEHQNEMSKQAVKEMPDEMIVEAKNTVLVLPKLRIRPTLVRLGEMHTNSMQCRDYRETNLSVAHMRSRKGYGEWSLPPGTIEGFVPFIKHPLKTLYVNPFPSIVDQYDAWLQQPVLITLKTSPKYFLHEQSVVPPVLAVTSN